MTKLPNSAISAALYLLGFPLFGNLAERWTDHRGLILMFHHIGSPGKESEVSRGLTVSPETLERVLNILAVRGYEVVPMDEVPDRLTGARAKRFAALTFDDGGRDTLTCAAPILVSHGAPFTVYVTTGFADGTVQPIELTKKLYLDWDGLHTLTRVPGCTIGCHTLTHPKLSQLRDEEARSELADSRSIIEERLGIQIRHFAYPYGWAAACGDREFELADRLGYATAVTTRHGVLTSRNADALTSLPRVPVNGNFEHPQMLEGLISGLPLFSLARRGVNL